MPCVTQAGNQRPTKVKNSGILTPIIQDRVPILPKSREISPAQLTPTLLKIAGMMIYALYHCLTISQLSANPALNRINFAFDFNI